VGRASLDLATLGLKGRSLISLPVRLRCSGFYFRRSDAVSAKGPATRHNALRRRWTELLGQLLGRSCCTTPMPQYRGYTGESDPQRHPGATRRHAVGAHYGLPQRSPGCLNIGGGLRRATGRDLKSNGSMFGTSAALNGALCLQLSPCPQSALSRAALSRLAGGEGCT